jgi:hypothetical protein
MVRPRGDARGAANEGFALVGALMVMLLLSAVGAALVLATSTETLIASNFRAARQAFYAADAAAEWGAADLEAAAADFATVLGGTVASAFVDGAPAGARLLADGSAVNLTAIAARSPSWSLYAYGPLERLLPAGPSSPFYIVVFIKDAGGPERIDLRAEAFGPRGAHRVVEVGLSRQSSGVKFESWREVR